MWVFIFGDMLLFTAYFCSFLWQRLAEPALFLRGQRALDPLYGLTNTLLLLTSSLFVLIGLNAVRNRNSVLAMRSFMIAVACAILFCIVKVAEWYGHVERSQTPSAGDFWLYYYILTGLHLIHVILGVFVLLLIGLRSRIAVQSGTSMMLIEGGCCWWHMVDLIWMILFPLMYLVQ